MRWWGVMASAEAVSRGYFLHAKAMIPATFSERRVELASAWKLVVRFLAPASVVAEERAMVVASPGVGVVASVRASLGMVSSPQLVAFGTLGARGQRLRRRFLGPRARRRTVSDYPDRRVPRRPSISDGISQQLIFPDLRLGDSDERGLGMHDGSLRGSLPRRVRGFYSGPA